MASQFYEWTHGAIHYTRRGMGDPLLLVHNLYPGASLEEFEFNIAELARTNTVYSIDLLGFGLSDAPAMRYNAKLYVKLLTDFIEKVIKRSTSVMCAGLSCGIVSQMAVWRQDLIDRLIFICPRSEPVEAPSVAWMAELRRFLLSTSAFGAGYYDVMTSDYELRDFLKQCFHHAKNVTPEKIERLREHSHRPGSQRAYSSLINGFFDTNILGTLPHVSAPVLLLWGRQAQPSPVEHSVRLAALTRDCQLHVIENAGSWAHDEQSAEVNRKVEAFLTQEEKSVVGIA